MWFCFDCNFFCSYFFAFFIIIILLYPRGSFFFSFFPCLLLVFQTLRLYIFMKRELLILPLLLQSVQQTDNCEKDWWLGLILVLLTSIILFFNFIPSVATYFTFIIYIYSPTHCCLLRRHIQHDWEWWSKN
jgi:hypothetical protein